MAQLVKVSNFEKSEKKTEEKYCRILEEGNILFFPQCPFLFPQEELDFLLAQKQTGASNRKNIAYKPQQDKISNFVHSSKEQETHLLEIMRSFSQRTIAFLSELLSPYKEHWQIDYASFRPFQEKGRSLRTRARNDLLHVDSFPTRPVHGKRIMRFFININPSEHRHWITSDPFKDLIERFGGNGGVDFPKEASRSLSHSVKKFAKTLGFPITLRSPYDIFMLNMHNYLKENGEFQRNCHKDHWNFPPHCAWIVFTDQVSHAALSGQYALEQTVLIPQQALLVPEHSPLSILEKLSGRKMLLKSS